MQKLVLFLALIFGLGVNFCIPKISAAQNANEVVISATVLEQISLRKIDNRTVIETNLKNGASVIYEGNYLQGNQIILDTKNSDSLMMVFASF